MICDRFALSLHLLLFLLVYADSVNSQVLYHITPSLDVPCPQDPCLTLSQFAAADSSSYLGNETNILDSLSFLPGNHSLDRELSLSHADNFTISRDIGGNGTVFVECGSRSGRFNISETTLVTIQGLYFIGCGGNSVSQVKQLIVKDSIFQGVEGRGTALVLNEVSAASITKCSFIYNTHGSTFQHHDNISSFTPQNILNYLYLKQNSSLAVGGALYTAFSNISIASSQFTHNTAEIGGALFAHGSRLHVIGSTYSYNIASFGGVMIASESIVDINNSSLSENAAKVKGGVIISFLDSFNISGSIFINNSAGLDSGVLETYESLFSITDSTFSDNSAERDCGVVYAAKGSFSIRSSTFTNNSAADDGGVIFIRHDSSFNIATTTFTNNSATGGGGVIAATNNSSFNITTTTFTDNSATNVGGVIAASDNSLFNIASSTFANNSAADDGGVIYIRHDSSFNIATTTFTNNSATDGGGVIAASDNSSFNITTTTFTDNSATNVGGVIAASDNCSFIIASSTFTNNSATYGGVMITLESSFNITSNNNSATHGGVIFTRDSSFNTATTSFTKNSAIAGGVIFCIGPASLNIDSSSFYTNKADNYGGIILTIGCPTHITSSTFVDNFGSLYIFNSNLTFSGYITFENCTEPSNKTATTGALIQEGGSITSVQSTVIFTGVIMFSNNQARHGGAILATESKIMIYGETTITNNTASTCSGGGISLHQSDLEIKGNCIISHNHAVRGGGIHATSSTIAVYQPATLQFINNRAKNGSGLYLEINPKLYILKYIRSFTNDEHLLIFSGNHANYGGALYVEDDTNSGTCLPDNECFIQTLSLEDTRLIILLITLNDVKLNTTNILFSGNTASEQGANLFGGLLDRCIPSPFAEVYQQRTSTHYSGISYLGNISNIIALDTISSLPVRVCYCSSEGEADCSYQPPLIKVKKGEAFTVILVAVDQVNHSVDANIISSLSSQDGGFKEGQQVQSVGRNCTKIIFNVFSPHDTEIINLFADGPCGSSSSSIQHLHIYFTNCTCPVGFEPFNSETRCECICDSKLSRYITNCNSTTETLLRVNTNSWITYINDTDPPGYVIHPNCPFDYCQPQTKNISINLNLPNGADTQCAYNRRGILCGACQEHLSLSLASSLCLPCHSHWPAVLVVIILAATIAGILLVAALLALNMTVAVGLINGFIFYANIVAANSAVVFPSSVPSFPTVFVAWLNLDIGVDICFFDSLDAYTKTWLQLVFPVYIISLVIFVIIVSEYSPRFAALIGKKDPIATLATLTLLSYAKLLSVTITALSFAVLDYPDGSRETVWLPDGKVKYFQGKHIALVLVALLITLIGAPYTFLLFLWQWLVRAPRWKVFKWTRNTKLNTFISAHHVPYNSKYRYWTGLLLLVRVVLYITASVTVSQFDNPQASLLITTILVGGISLITGPGARVYKESFVNMVNTVLYFNLLALAAFSLYDSKTDMRKQTAVAYTSTIITFILLVGVIIYHVSLLVRKAKPPEELNEYPLAPVQYKDKAEVTHSVIEIPKPHDLSPPPEADETANVTSIYTSVTS